MQGDCLFADWRAGYIQKDIVSRDELNGLYQMVRSEIKEIDSFNECMESRKKFKEQKDQLLKKHRDLKADESKVISGKSSIRNVFSKKTKEESASEIKV